MLVLRLHGEIANVCLLTNEVELAGAGDVLLVPAETGLPYPLLAERVLCGSVFVRQLDLPLGHVDLRILDRSGAGVPIISRRDGRWDWKLSELTELHDLGRACLSRIFAGD